MPITWQTSDDWIYIVFTNPYSIGESEKAMKEIFAQPAIAPPLRFLVDVRATTPPDTEFVVNAINFWQLHVDVMWGARIAVVTANDAQSNMAEMSERSAESRELPFTIRAFPDAQRHEAERWLRAP